MTASRHIPGTVTEVDAETGAEIHKPMAWHMVRPPEGRCQFCAAAHAPAEPHDATSLYYQMAFEGIVGRSPTWADALAHCSSEIKTAWERELRKLNAWTEPPAGEMPVAHHGIE